MLTKPVNGGALLFIKNGKNFKLRPHIYIKKDKELESAFVEILIKTCKYIIVGYIYRYRCMHPKEFNNLFLKSLTDNLNKENIKEIILLGEFNIDLIKTNSNKNNDKRFNNRVYSSFFIMFTFLKHL